MNDETKEDVHLQRTVSEVANTMGEWSLQEHRERFQEMDLNQSGTITPQELECYLHGVLGRKPTPDEVDHVFKRMDCDSNGEITLREFVLWHKPSASAVAGLAHSVALTLWMLPKTAAAKFFASASLMQRVPLAYQLKRVQGPDYNRVFGRFIRDMCGNSFLIFTAFSANALILDYLRLNFPASGNDIAYLQSAFCGI